MRWLAFYDFPRALEALTNDEPIESTFATVRQPQIDRKVACRTRPRLAMVSSWSRRAEKLRAHRRHNQLPKLIQGVKFTDGIEVIGILPRLKSSRA